MSRKEKAFQAEFNVSCKHMDGIHFYQIPNAPFSKCIRRVPIYKPYDCYALYRGSFYAFELKVWDTKISFPFNRLQDHQLAALKSAEYNGGIGYIIINYKNIVDNVKYNFAMYFRPREYEYLQSSLGRKSIPVSYAIDLYEENIDVLSRCKYPDGVRGWKVDELFWK